MEYRQPVVGRPAAPLPYRATHPLQEGEVAEGCEGGPSDGQQQQPGEQQEEPQYVTPLPTDDLFDGVDAELMKDAERFGMLRGGTAARRALNDGREYCGGVRVCDDDEDDEDRDDDGPDDDDIRDDDDDLDADAANALDNEDGDEENEDEEDDDDDDDVDDDDDEENEGDDDDDDDNGEEIVLDADRNCYDDEDDNAYDENNATAVQSNGAVPSYHWK